MNPDPLDNRDPGPPHVPPDQSTDAEHSFPHPHEVGAPPPAVPRPLTSFVRLRALFDPRARFWALTAVVLSLISAYFFFNSLHARSHEAWLIAQGVRINATVRMANDEFVPHRPQPPDSVVMLRFPWQGSDIETAVTKLPGRNTFIETGSTLPIHVNPQDPNDWTWLNEPLPVLNRAIGAVITLPMAALAMLWTLFLRGRLLRIWRHGQAVEALIIATRSTAVAPHCRAAQVTPSDEKDKRIYTVFLPPRFADMEAGDALYIIRRSARSRSAVAAEWFDQS